MARNTDYRANGRIHDMRPTTAKTKASMSRVNKRGQVVSALTKKFGMKNPMLKGKKKGLGAKMRTMAAQQQTTAAAQSPRSGGIGGMVRQAVAQRQAAQGAPTTPTATPAKGGIAGLVGQAVKAQQGAAAATPKPAPTASTSTTPQPTTPAAPTTPAQPMAAVPSTSGFRQRTRR
jgi:hypothetical protein